MEHIMICRQLRFISAKYQDQTQSLASSRETVIFRNVSGVYYLDSTSGDNFLC